MNILRYSHVFASSTQTSRSMPPAGGVKGAGTGTPASAPPLTDWLGRPSGIRGLRYQDPMTEEKAATKNDPWLVYPAINATIREEIAASFYKVILNELYQEYFPYNRPTDDEHPEIFQDAFTALRSVKWIYKKYFFRQRYAGGSLLQLFRRDPDQVLHYPLPREYLYIKTPWFPSINSLIKISSSEFREGKRQGAKMASEPTTKPKQEAEQVGLKVCLMSTQALFENRQSLPERTFEKVMDTAKKILGRSQRDAGVRQFLGADAEIWKEFNAVFETAVPVLEALSFASEDPSIPNSNGSSSTLMASNHNTLMKDLERLNDLIMIARNMLATTKRAQNLAGDSQIDQQVLKLIDVCVRVTARGYDGDAGSRSETQWANVVGSYKKLLITSLQFLHNFVMRNEKRKLLLWLDLFANSRSADHYFSGTIDPYRDEVARAARAQEGILSKKISEVCANGDVKESTKDNETLAKGINVPPEAGAQYTSELLETVDDLVNLTVNQGREKSAGNSDASQGEPPLQKLARMSENVPSSVHPQNQSWSWTSLPDPSLHTDLRGSAIKAEDMRCVRTPQSAAVTLQAAKDQLMARLQDTSPDEEGDEHGPYAGSENDEGDVRGSDVAADGSIADNNDEEDDEYRGPGDQERGLLTDIPLVLGPQEIEALPMIIQAGIVGGLGPKSGPEGKGTQDMQGVRCNILLAQEAGRNLLRELLIFIAAWDLQDDEFYFKMMMQIMEAILENGLMPFAYQAFGEVKDIVSPAQSMVIKILTQIFRGKQGLPPAASRAPATATPPPRREPPTRVDLLIVKYIFTIFRQCIIPETCALIYLQGQIRAGAALPEDFPLNLWDMERVYEGVYQFLEFFAVLTESEDWKGLLVSWEIVSELVTLLRELDASIPKVPLSATIPQTVAEAEAAQTAEDTSKPVPSTTLPGLVERPYDHLTDRTFPSADYAPSSASDSPSAAIDNADPSDFEWRNLKKLVVLVLSSLVWKSTTVQNQIRHYGGVEMILSCCNFDANNPYIREHAIMCLRFLLEGNRDNMEIVRALEPRKGVPEEVLDKRGYETFIDEKGKVGLRAKDGSGVVPA